MGSPQRVGKMEKKGSGCVAVGGLRHGCMEEKKAMEMTASVEEGGGLV